MCGSRKIHFRIHVKPVNKTCGIKRIIILAVLVPLMIFINSGSASPTVVIGPFVIELPGEFRQSQYKVHAKILISGSPNERS